MLPERQCETNITNHILLWLYMSFPSRNTVVIEFQQVYFTIRQKQNLHLRINTKLNKQLLKQT